MIRSIVETSLKYKVLVIAFAMVMVVAGLSILKKMPVDVFPEFEPPTVEIQIEALGLSAPEVESLVTLNVEEMLSGMPWLESIQSESIPGLSSIVLVFKPGTNILRARQFIQENLSRAYTLPNISKPPMMLQPLSSTRRFMMVGLSSDRLTPIDLSVVAQWTIKPRLLTVPGVANVVIWGLKNRQLQVLIDPKRLQANKLTQEQIIKTTGDALWFSRLSFLHASVPGTGGWIDTPNQRLAIRHVFPISSAKDLAKLPIDGSKLRLSDIADVVEGHPPLIGDIILDGNPGIILVVEKFPNANVIDVTQGVEKTLDLLKIGLPNIKVDTQIFQLASYVNSAFDNLTLALLISAVLIALLLLLVLTDWRTGFIIFVTIPMSLLTAIFLLYIFGVSINIMVLTGLGIALVAILDDSIIDITNIVKKLRNQHDAKMDNTIETTITNASNEVRTPIIYATGCIILVILPVFFFHGFTAEFLKPLALTYALALLASMMVAFTITPVLASLLIKPNVITWKSRLGDRLRDHYKTLLENIISIPKMMCAAVVVLLLIGLIIWLLVGQTKTLLPVFQEKDLIVEVEGIPSMSNFEIKRILSRLSAEIKTIPGVINVAALTGRAITSDKITDIDSGEIWIATNPKADIQKMKETIQHLMKNYPGIEGDVHGFLESKIKKMSTDENEIVVRINGPKYDDLQGIAEQVKQTLANIKDITDLKIEDQVYEPQINIEVDINKAAPYGIKPGDVRRAAATVFAGIEAGNIFKDQKVFEVVIWSIPEARNSITSLENLMIDRPDGGYVRLGDVAKVSITPTPTVINHYGISPYIDIVANVKGRSVSAVTREVETVLHTIQFPLEYHPEILGDFLQNQALKMDLYLTVLGVVVIIFFLLQAAFNSWRLALLEFLALPIAIVGGLIAIALNGGVISLGALVGFLAVLGLSVRHGILLIKCFQDLERKNHVLFGPELIMRGTREQFAPILMTTIITIAALVPFLILGSCTGLEIIHSMAVVILGGLITSTILNLTIIPSLYLLIGSHKT